MKKDEYKFTLRFDKNDPDHQEAARILNSYGQKKSRFLTSAILSYEKYNKESSLSIKNIDELTKIIMNKLGNCSGSVEVLSMEDENLLGNSLKAFQI